MSLWQTSSSFLSYRWELLHSHGNLCAIAGPTAFIVFLLLSVSSFCLSSIAAHGFYLLMVIGKPEGHFENTTAIVMLGAYKYIRHPLYASLILFAWGTF